MFKTIVKKSLIIATVVLLVLSIVSSLYVSAAETPKSPTGGGSYTMNVGDSKILILHVDKAITGAAWTSTCPWEVVVTEQDEVSCKIRVDEYVSSTVIIHCEYTFMYSNPYGGGIYLGRGYDDFYIDINPPANQGGGSSGGGSSYSAPNKITIKFNPRGGTVSRRKKRVTANTSVGALPTPKRKGYFFDGWYTDKKYGSQIYSGSSFSYSTTLYAHWTKAIKIVLKPRGGKIKKNYKKVRKGYSIGGLPRPTRKNYHFDGWYTKAKGGRRVHSSDSFKAKKTVYAHWTKLIKIKLKTRGGTLKKTYKKIPKGKKVGKLAKPKRKGYLFDGWFTKAKGGKKITSKTKFRANKTLYAHWVGAVKIKFNAAGGTVSTKFIRRVTGKKIGKMPKPKRKGYTFKGWYTKKTGGKKITSKTKLKKSKTIYAHWAKKIQITFNPNGGTVSNSKTTITSGDALGTLPTPKRNGYKFDGWYKSDTATEKAKAKDTEFKKSTELYARWESENEEYKYVLGNKIAIIKKYKGKSENIQIPDTIEDKRVTVIGGSAFADNTAIKSVVIPDGVTTLDEFAFGACTNMVSVTIPDSVKTIWVHAFVNCKSLTSITIPGSVKEIYYAVFSDCNNLKSVIIGDGVTSIAKGAFGYCGALESITIPQSVTSIEASAFKQSKKLTIYGYNGTYAKNFAEANGYKFVALD